MTRNSIKSFRLFAALVAIVIASSTASADLILSFGASNPNPIVAGSSGTLDVFVRANTGTQVLDGFLLNLQITGTGVTFPTIQSTSFLTSPTYVFFGRSQTFNTGSIVGVGDDAGNYNGSDVTDDGSFIPNPGAPSPVTLNSTDNMLLVRLNLSGVSPGTFSINVNPTNSTFFSDQNDAGNTSIAFTASSGSVTVSAVPEPTSVCLVVVSLATLAFRRRVLS